MNTRHIMVYVRLIPTTFLAICLIKPIMTTPTVNRTKCGFIENTGKQGFQMPIMETLILQECPDKVSHCDAVGKPEAQSNCRECCLMASPQSQTTVGPSDKEIVKNLSKKRVVIAVSIIVPLGVVAVTIALVCCWIHRSKSTRGIKNTTTNGRPVASETENPQDLRNVAQETS